MENKNEYQNKVFIILRERYKNANKQAKKELKEKLYADNNLTEKQKDKIWADIMRFCNK